MKYTGARISRLKDDSFARSEQRKDKLRQTRMNGETEEDFLTSRIKVSRKKRQLRRSNPGCNPKNRLGVDGMQGKEQSGDQSIAVFAGTISKQFERQVVDKQGIAYMNKNIDKMKHAGIWAEHPRIEQERCKTQWPEVSVVIKGKQFLY